MVPLVASYIDPPNAALFGVSIAPVAPPTFEIAQSSLFGPTLRTTPVDIISQERKCII
jgi:hypothetical protein